MSGEAGGLEAVLAGSHRVKAIDVGGTPHEYDAFINDALATELAAAVRVWLKEQADG